MVRCACRKLNPGILVMQSAQDWATKNVPGAIDGARDRRIFLQCSPDAITPGWLTAVLCQKFPEAIVTGVSNPRRLGCVDPGS
jgi:hypothetical protein